MASFRTALFCLLLGTVLLPVVCAKINGQALVKCLSEKFELSKCLPESMPFEEAVGRLLAGSGSEEDDFEPIINYMCPKQDCRDTFMGLSASSITQRCPGVAATGDTMETGVLNVFPKVFTLMCATIDSVNCMRNVTKSAPLEPDCSKCSAAFVGIMEDVHKGVGEANARVSSEKFKAKCDPAMIAPQKKAAEDSIQLESPKQPPITSSGTQSGTSTPNSAAMVAPQWVLAAAAMCAIVAF